MNELKKNIENTIFDLTKKEKMVKERLANDVPGRLRVNVKNGKPRYYRRMPGENTGKYIKKKNEKEAMELAQKMYDEKILQTILTQKKILLDTSEKLEKSNSKKVFDTFHDSVKKLIQPIHGMTTQMIHNWENEEYNQRVFQPNAPEIYTEKGERVLSKSEKIIADKLYKMHIPYKYERPLFLKGYGEVRPDFTLLNVRNGKEIYWEHLGMMDDEQYCEKALRKIETYMKNEIYIGDGLIISWETKNWPINVKLVEKMIIKYVGD